MTPGRCSRGVRAATFAAVCVLLAATGHILMSGQAVPGWALGHAFVGTAAAAWALAGRERGLLAVTAVTVAVQSVLHTVFSWSQPAGAVPTHAADTAMDHTHMGHATMGHEVLPQAAAAMPGAPATHDMTNMSSSLGMLSAHLFAALLSGLWMAYGERAVFRLLRAMPLGLFRPLRLLLAVVVPVRPRPRLRPVRAGDERVPRQLFLAHSVISRGPPRALAVL
ncbi:hypothetical protein OG462_06410 [Streptomyces sp. NBC_01077]|uniref:hypothetical protein n=1 Tax=Streptomyces sp. NBC_01077 TaxID=2903746 RepID=UPI003870BBC0|nr:hypothetical protein OG462_06410 [Streptomyces sp. NBC_01077]